MISAVLLAAGKSERMGRFKQLLPLGRKTFVECCVDNLLASGLDEVIVVTGHNEEAVRSVLAGRPVQFAYNVDYGLGMASSIVRGFRSVSASNDAVMIALADQPLITPEAIKQLIRAYQRSSPLITIPRYLGRTGHPIIIAKRLASEIESMDLQVGLRQVIAANISKVHYVEVDEEGILLDFDYPEEYRQIENLDQPSRRGKNVPKNK